MHAGQNISTYDSLQALHLTLAMDMDLDAGQAFASGLDINPACERLQAGLTEAGQCLDGRLLVAALDRAASAAAAVPAGTPAGAAGSGQGLRQARAPGAPGQRRTDAGAAHAYQLTIELRLSKVHVCAAAITVSSISDGHGPVSAGCVRLLFVPAQACMESHVWATGACTAC